MPEVRIAKGVPAEEDTACAAFCAGARDAGGVAAGVGADDSAAKAEAMELHGVREASTVRASRMDGTEYPWRFWCEVFGTQVVFAEA